jgi:hypothetical protein
MIFISFFEVFFYLKLMYINKDGVTIFFEYYCVVKM